MHSAVTGPKARASSKIDGRKLEVAWEALQTSWEEFENLRNISRAGIVGAEEKIRFVDGWQVRSLMRFFPSVFSLLLINQLIDRICLTPQNSGLDFSLRLSQCHSPED